MIRAKQSARIPDALQRRNPIRWPIPLVDKILPSNSRAFSLCKSKQHGLEGSRGDSGNVRTKHTHRRCTATSKPDPHEMQGARQRLDLHRNSSHNARSTCRFANQPMSLHFATLPDASPESAPESPHASKRAQKRDRLEMEIIEKATRIFAEHGYEGSSLSDLAEKAGLSKQNLLYYFPTKIALYERVLDEVLDDWIERMSGLNASAQDIGGALVSYIEAKLRFSKEKPWASRVFATEIISGLPIYGETMRAKLLPLMRRDIALFEQWMAEGKIARVNATHLLFSIWALTQSYADFSAQMCLVLGHSPLRDGDFDDASQLISRMVLAACGLEQRTPDN